MIYAAASRALCALEILANANALAADYMVTPIEVPEDLSVVTLSVDELPSGWDAAQPTPATAEIGTAWAEKLQPANPHG